MIFKSAFIWLPPEKPGEFQVNIGAKVINVSQTQLKVVDDNGKVRISIKLILRMCDDLFDHCIFQERVIVNDPANYTDMHSTSHSDIPDMIHLGDLNEGAICRNIFLRYNKDKIYVSFDFIF